MKPHRSGAKTGMAMMADKVFVDTNVLLRSLIDQFPESSACRGLLLEQRKAEKELWISRQVVRELLVQMTHPKTLSTLLTRDQVQFQMRTVLRLFKVANETSDTTTMLLTLMRDYAISGKQVHDANIVAVMLTNQINTLLTLNTVDFKRYSDRITLLIPR
jgi:predicted nucleic acid-binding protein